MSLIEKYGSYDAVKSAALNYRNSGDVITASKFEKELLEHRREHGIFEDNDFIVHKNSCENSMLFKVKNISDNGYSYGNDWGWRGVLSSLGVSSDFRHADDVEIKARRRL